MPKSLRFSTAFSDISTLSIARARPLIESAQRDRFGQAPLDIPSFSERGVCLDCGRVGKV